MYKKLLLTIVVILIAIVCTNQSIAQGITTASISGNVKDEKGNPLEGATITALHTPSGTEYGAISRKNGEYILPAVRIGGPYIIQVSFVGFQPKKEDGINLSLGQEFSFNAKLAAESLELSEVVVVSNSNSAMNSNRTGAATNISREQIQQLPTINRSLSDYTRLVPQGGGPFNSIGGRNGMYNNITIDGAIFNNSFGLSSTIAGQANTQPISLDAIDQVQVNIAPFDVRQGSFTGAGINAVTRSGTNDFSGSAYGFFRNQEMGGREVGDAKVLKQYYATKQYGFRLGGPIVKDKLFFFINGEAERRDDPGTFLRANRPGVAAPGPGSNTASVNASDLDQLRKFLIDKYKYDPGAYEGYKLNTYSNKVTARIDWNISKNHKFNIKYNYLKSYRDVPPSNSGTFAGGGAASFSAMPLQSNFYRINNNMNSIIAELNSTFGNSLSNNFTVGYTGMRDFRESQVNSTPFPTVQINNVTSFGFEPFSAGNKLNTDVYQLSDYFSIYRGKHSITIGTYNEFYHFENGFAPNFYGSYQFSSLSDFMNSANGVINPTNPNGYPYQPTSYLLQYSALPGTKFPIAEFNATQLGLFVQDEWKPLENLKLTAGLRADLPILPTKLQKNETAEALVFRDGMKVDVSKYPKTKVLWSPRVGFNLDVFNDKSTQVRGGTGIFTGRIPYVWISNQAGNNGVLYGSISSGSKPGNYAFSEDVQKYIPANLTANPTFNLAVTDPDFKFPQVWRTNLAVDRVLPGGIIGTFEANFTKDLNAVYHSNINLPVSSTNANSPSEDGDKRPVYFTLDPTNAPSYVRNNNQLNATIPTGGSGGAILMSNTNKGYSYFLTAQLAKTFNKFFYVSAAYTYAQSKDVNSGGNIAASVWRDRTISGDPNANVTSYSNYMVNHRVVASATYRKEYLKNFATSISLFYEAQPAGRFSYVYNGDMNGDATGGNNDLMWIPGSQDDIVLVDQTYTDKDNVVNVYTKAQQWSDLESYINDDPYLKKHKGEYAERNGAQLPWYFKMDLRILQDFYINTGGKRHTLQLSMDMFNLGNFLNSKWGLVRTTSRSYNGANNSVALLAFRGYNQQGQPTYSFDPLSSPTRTNGITAVTPLKETYNYNFDFISRWQMQIGVRYIFN